MAFLLGGGLAVTGGFGAFSQPAEDSIPDNGPENSYGLLAQALERTIDQFDWGGGSLGVSVWDLDRGVAIYEREARRGLPPVSVLKLALAAVALESLGPSFSFATELLVSGPIRDRVLEGDLIVVGTGDPTLSRHYLADERELMAPFDQWVRELKAEGVRRVRGGLLVDDAAFDGERLGPGWPLEELGSPRLPEISALNFNDNCVEVNWRAGRRTGQPGRFEVWPDLEGMIFLSSNVRVSAVDAIARRYRRSAGSRVVHVTGTLRPSERSVDRAAVAEPALFFGHVLRSRLERAGIRIEGKVEARPTEAPAEGEPPRSVASWSSPPLERIVGEMMRHDRTLEAEAILRTLALGQGGAPGSFRGGARAVEDQLRAWEISTSGLAVIDGSGLSRLNRLSAAQVMDVFRRMRSHRLRALFEAALAATDRPGILADRFPSPEPDLPRPQVSAIGGSLSGCESLAGWALSRHQYPIHFAILVADSGLPNPVLRTQVDALVGQMAQSGIR